MHSSNRLVIPRSQDTSWLSARRPCTQGATAICCILYCLCLAVVCCAGGALRCTGPLTPILPVLALLTRHAGFLATPHLSDPHGYPG